MRRVGTSTKRAGLRGLVVVFASLVVAGGVLADLMLTNAAGVRAGITGIVTTTQTGDINVQFAVRDPTGTNVTSFAIQRSLNLTNWTDISTLTVTGNFPVTGMGSAAIADTPVSPAQFYRMRLMNF